MTRGIALSLVLGAIISIALVMASESFYPVRVAFGFEYNGQSYEKSYTTLMRLGLCDLETCLIRWDPGRDKLSTSLPDGTSLILKAVWPFPWQRIPGGRANAFAGRWVWLNNQVAPTQIVYGDGALQLTSDHPLFTWIKVSATIERLSEISIIQAVISDNLPDDTSRLLNSAAFGGSFQSIGRLFAGIEAAPLQGDGLAGIKDLADWVNLSDGCRVLPERIGAPSTPGIARDWPQNRVLIRHDDLWSYDGGPHPGEAFIMYPAGKSQPAQFPQLYLRSVLQQIHAFEFNGKRCSGIELPVDSYAAFVDLGDGRTIVGLWPSAGFVVFRD